MSRKIFAVLLVIAAFTGYNVYQSQGSNALSDLILANQEVLAGEESECLYEEKEENSLEVWDDESQTYDKIVTINCKGKGSLKC